jgi:glycosyltransferase involved in cell wall biosynthesis
MAVKADDVLFTIMILSIPSRLDKLSDLYNRLQEQIGDRTDVEVLCLVDNKSMTIGEKRNVVLNAARGRFVACLDDDDTISDDYVEKICENLTDEVDVLCFEQHCTINGEEVMVSFDMRNEKNDSLTRDDNGKLVDMKRLPWHMCVWNRDIAKETPFQSSSYGEDWDWCSRMIPKVKRQVKLFDILHYYQYTDEESESIQYQNNPSGV